jgi:hypothetical protein
VRPFAGINDCVKCIDAIEGGAKRIIGHLVEDLVRDRLDDTEYIRNIKAVVEGSHRFVVENPEVTNAPQVLREVLYAFAKDQWMNHLAQSRTTTADKPDSDLSPSLEYYYYYYDHIYDHEAYPS